MRTGADKKAIYFQDIDLPSFEKLLTYSDVFGIFQQDVRLRVRFPPTALLTIYQNLIYAGTRNGSIQRFDKRTCKRDGQKLFDDRFLNQQRSSVLHLEIIRDTQLLTSHMNGEVCIHALPLSKWYFLTGWFSTAPYVRPTVFATFGTRSEISRPR
jgi:WD repeat-containing protein 21A